MESYLAGRSKVAPKDPLPASEPMATASSGGLSGLDAFGGGFGQGSNFQSLREALLEVGSVVDPGDMHKGHAGADGQVHRGEPSVEAITNNGRVEKIVVTCSCGEKVEIECCY